MPGARKRIAVLGGGVGGMTAAFELTATPQLRDRFDVTVYQLGWRLGGKGASGRNAAHGQRIEEHGLHVWFGFYDNAFRLMRDAYAELGRPANAPLATFEEAFVGCDQLVLYDRVAGRWHAHRFDMPRNSLRPGDTTELPTFWEMAARAVRWALDGWRLIGDHRATPADPFTPGWFENLALDLGFDLPRLPLDGAERLLGLALALAGERARHTDHSQALQAAQPGLLVRLLRGFRDWLWEAIGHGVEDDPFLRIYFTCVDAGVATIAGIVEDGILERGFDVVNDEEWSDWLHRHGASRLTLGDSPAERAPCLRSVYDVAFGYLGGDIDRANVAAGTATSDLLRLVFSYRGSIMFKMQAGMGDVVFTPLYQVLRDRGVRFEFFRAVTNLGVSGDAIDTVSVVPQVELVGDEYKPLVEVRELDCWPSEPRWEQLVGGERLRAAGVDFELSHNPLSREPQVLRRGADFDSLVLSIPIGAIPEICPELIANNDRFARAVEKAETAQTQAFQLWVSKDAGRLGWEHSENSVTGCYVEPLDTYCDMTHLLGREDWARGDGARTIGYFCGVLDELEGETPAEATKRVRANAQAFMENDLGEIWPRFSRDDLISDFYRANVTATERYVLTPAGSVEHRLPSGDSGFANLKLAGDWTRNGIDGGCVEAAVISGMDAARALIGIDGPVPGSDTRWLRPQAVELPVYTEFGGRVTAPAPFACMGGRLRSFVLRGDRARIDELVRRMFDQPAGAAVEYRAFTSSVVLMIGSFDRVSSQTPPFDRWGSVRETQASFFVPVLAGRDLGDLFVADRLLMAVPYILVDNPMSYLGGRETYGYAKTMGRFSPESGLGDSISIEAFGGDFGRGEGAAWRELLSVSGNPRSEGEWLDGPQPFADLLTDGLPSLDGEGRLTIPGFQLGPGLVENALSGRTGQVFLKQFRDAADGTRACYQSVVEAPVVVKHVRSRVSDADWSVRINAMDSHPLGPELGLGTQPARAAFDVEMDFVVDDGVEVGRVAPTPATEMPPLPPTAGDGLGSSLLGATAQWAWREFVALERASLGLLRRRL